MIDQNKVREAVNDMIQNPDWRDVLDNAPGGAKLRVGLAFYASKNLDAMSQEEKDQYRQFREQLEMSLNAEELQYLVSAFDRMGVDSATKHYQELLSKVSQNQGAEQGQEG